MFLGLELIAKVPSQLHTPLMSGSNAISGITLIGSLASLRAHNGPVAIVLGTLAVAIVGAGRCARRADREPSDIRLQRLFLLPLVPRDAPRKLH